MTRLTLLAVPLLLCIACSREEPASAPEPSPAPATTETQPSPAPAPLAPAAAPAPTDPAAEFDTGAFAGTFTGGGLRLELHADGSYGLEGPEGVSQGSWTHEAATGSIRLDPGSKTAQDRVFRMSGANTLADGSTTLTRQATP
ncbi:MAG: hypothetical protein ACOY37_13340 [Pseudomonadota bacterium]